MQKSQVCCFCIYCAMSCLLFFSASYTNAIPSSRLTTLDSSLLSKRSPTVSTPSTSSNSGYSKGYVWLYTFLSVTALTLLAGAGVLIAPLLATSSTLWNRLSMTFLIGIGVGTLLGDALIHLFLDALGFHHHTHGHDEHHDHPHDHGDKETKSTVTSQQAFIISMTLLAGILFFYFADHLCRLYCPVDHNHHNHVHHHPPAPPEYPSSHSYSHSHSHSHGHGHTHPHGTSHDHGSMIKSNQHHHCHGHTSFLNSCPSTSATASASASAATTTSFKHDPLLPSTTSSSSTSKDSLSPSLSPTHSTSDLTTDRAFEPYKNNNNHTPTNSSLSPTSTLTSPPTVEKHTVGLILFGDALHNFMDGIAIGVTFAESASKGWATTLTVLFHELPHELGDIAVLLSSGLSKTRVALYNAASNVTSYFGAILGIVVYSSFSKTSLIQPCMLAFTAGGFLYIALSNFIPMLMNVVHHTTTTTTTSTSSTPSNKEDVLEIHHGSDSSQSQLLDNEELENGSSLSPSASPSPSPLPCSPSSSSSSHICKKHTCFYFLSQFFGIMLGILCMVLLALNE